MYEEVTNYAISNQGRKRYCPCLRFYADVTKIEVEVEDVVKPSEDDIDDTYYRTIRFVGFNGEAIEVFCAGFDNQSVKLKRVKQLKPVPKPDVEEWLTPSTAHPEE
jgi:hypothetical protein